MMSVQQARARRHTDLVDRALCVMLLTCGAAGIAWIVHAMVTLRLPCLLFL